MSGHQSQVQGSDRRRYGPEPVSPKELTGIDSSAKNRVSALFGIRTVQRLANGYRFRDTRAAWSLKCVTFQTHNAL